MLEEVVKFCCSLIERAQPYLDFREISLATAKELRLGYFPMQFTDLFKEVDPKALRARGIVLSASRSSLSGRLIFPMSTWQGKVVSLSGRKVSEKVHFGPKYYNLPYREPYAKSKVLYNLSKALKAIEEEEEVVVVEGQIDAVRLWQSGIKNVVAVCGSSLTPYHVMLLARYCRRVILVFDNDASEVGQEAARKVIKRYCISGLRFESRFLPECKDVDDFGRLVGGEVLRQWIKDPLSFLV